MNLFMTYEIIFMKLGAGKDWEKNDLHYCFEQCDGCGHCGAGVPKNVTKCSDEIAERVKAWVSE